MEKGNPVEAKPGEHKTRVRKIDLTGLMALYISVPDILMCYSLVRPQNAMVVAIWTSKQAPLVLGNSHWSLCFTDSKVWTSLQESLYSLTDSAASLAFYFPATLIYDWVDFGALLCIVLRI